LAEFHPGEDIMYRIRGVSFSLILSALLLAAGSDDVFAQQRPSGARPTTPAIDAPAAGAERPASVAVEPLRTAVDRPIDIKDIRLDLRVDLAKKLAEGSATMQIRSLRPIKHVELDAVAFHVKKVSLAQGDGSPQPAQHTHDGKKLTILLPTPWSAGQEATLRVDYRVEDPKEGLHFFGPTAAEPDTPRIVWSQGEPTSNRYWFPCIDEPDERQTTEIVVTVPEGFEAVSNGKLLSRKTSDDGKSVIFDWRQDKPHPSYLVTLVVGQFDVVREEWDRVPVLYYVPRGKKDQVAPTFARTREMLAFFSKRFGIHYPWDKYAQVVAYRFGGGMENTSATTMGDILQDQRSILERDSDSIISHELAHQWWGDLVTCRDWAHIWLNEGFASYAEALWDEHRDGADAYAYNMYQKAGGAISGGKTRPVVDRRYPTAMSMFDGRAYPKGAWVLHMLRRRVGEDVFFKAVEQYGSGHRLQSAETADFRRTMERVTGRNLERFFYDWTERPGNPVLDVTTEYTPASQQARVVVKQTQSGEPFHFPLTLRVSCAGAAKPVVVEQDVMDKENTFLIPLPGTPTRVEIDPEQAILAEIKETKGRDLWADQLLQGSSVPVRLRAVRHFRDSKTDEDRELLARALAEEKFWGVQTEIASALADMGGETARAALMEGCRHSNARVRRACMQGLGNLQSDSQIAEFAAQVLRKSDPSYGVCGAAMLTYVKHKGKDAVAVLSPWLTRPSHNDTLRASALAALAQTQDPAALDLLLQYAKAGNPRTSRGAALRGLTQFVRKAKLSDEQSKQIETLLAEGLQGDDMMTQFVVLNATTELGPLASSLLPAVEKLSRDGSNERIRELAKQTAEKIRGQDKSAAAPATAEVKQLREEVEKLKREQADLRERLRKLEKPARE
jgi:aminopeptidase N